MVLSENFEGMGNSATATLPAGFRIGPDWSTGTTTTTLAYGTAGTGAVTSGSSGGVINWANGATATATDRALGFLNTGAFTSPRSITYAFTNNTGVTIDSLAITFDYEKYRSGSRQFDWTFFHGPTSNPTISATAGDQSYPADATNTVVSNPPLTTSKSVNLTGLSIGNGTTYYLRWTFTGLAGSTNGQGIGIDNFSITATGSAPVTTAGSLQFSQTNYDTAEGDSGFHDVTITVTRTCGSDGTVSVQYATSDGTATVADNDYVAASGTLNWNAGDATDKTFTVTVKGDAVPESNETVNLGLTSPTGGATLGNPNPGTLTILNDDGTPSPTPTATATATPTATATATPTATATATPISTPTATPIATATAAPTATATTTPIATATAIPTATPSATPTATPTTTPTQPLNISTRLRVEIGDKVMIAGFIITGNSSKTVLLRGLGPSLVNAGLSDVLQDTVLELRSSNGSLIFKNDNWKDDQRSLIEGTPFQPTDDRESVIVVTLPPGAYTTVLTGKDQTTGVGLVELYDISQAVDSQLANISTRGFVQPGANVMIGGFILGNGSSTTHVAIVGLGPSLAQFALNNLLEDPTLELHDGNGAIIASNDDWIDDPISAAALITNGLAPENVKESGIYVSLLPGQFTAILAGKNGGIGVGLVEIYNLR
jgi:Calx-beta domain